MALTRFNNNAIGETITAAKGGTGVTSADEIGNLVLLNSASGSSSISQLDIDSTYINSTYNNYRLYINLSPNTDNVYPRVRFFVDGTIRSGSSDYTYNDFRLDSSARSRGTGDGVAQISLLSEATQGYEAYEKLSCVIDLTDITSTDQRATLRSWNVYKNTAYVQINTISYGALKDTGHDAVNGIRFYYASGNIDYYDYKLYGVKE